MSRGYFGGLLWAVAKPTNRKTAAGFMLITGLGRLGLWTTRAQSVWLSINTFAFLLSGLGLLLLLTVGRRTHWMGRIVAGLSAVLLTGMAYDVLTAAGVNVTFLLELGICYLLVVETVATHD
jgi:hypothetical protein